MIGKLAFLTAWLAGVAGVGFVSAVGPGKTQGSSPMERTITVPLVWYPRLLDATPEQRRNWQIIGAGYGIHWPDVDEDLSTEGLLRGAPAPRVAAGVR
jgi:hypothetical protein